MQKKYESKTVLDFSGYMLHKQIHIHTYKLFIVGVFQHREWDGEPPCTPDLPPTPAAVCARDPVKAAGI